MYKISLVFLATMYELVKHPPLIIFPYVSSTLINNPVMEGSSIVIPPLQMTMQVQGRVSLI